MGETMGTTTNYAWPYPELTDPPNGPAQIKALADAVDLSAKTFLPPPRVQVRQTVAQSIPNGGGMLTFDAEDVDTHGMHSTSGDTTKLICVIPGLYLVDVASRYGRTAWRME